MNSIVDIEEVLDFINKNPWLWGVIAYVIGLAVNEALAVANKRWPDSKLVDWLTLQAHAFLGTLPARIQELKDKAASDAKGQQ